VLPVPFFPRRAARGVFPDRGDALATPPLKTRSRALRPEPLVLFATIESESDAARQGWRFFPDELGQFQAHCRVCSAERR
jgi:hypothetical protein